MKSKHNLEKLFSNYLIGSASEEELQDLLNLFQVDHDSDLLHQLIADALDSEEEESLLTQKQYIIVDNVGEVLANRIRIQKLKWRRMYVACGTVAATLLLGSFLWLINRTHSPLVTDTLQTSTPIPPGEDKAILVMEDGTRINLDKQVYANSNQRYVYRDQDGMMTFDTQDLPAKNFTGQRTISTPIGGQVAVVLPDGSKVWLNAKSSITFPLKFGEATRTVEIKGEVYFEVAKKVDQTFMVQTGMQTVKVLGTHFNINAYPEHQSVKTSLLEGSVEIQTDKKTLQLKPGQMSVWRANKNGLTLYNNIDLVDIMAWKDGIFSFNNTNIKDIMYTLSRWYDVEVVFEADDYSDCFFTGMISKKENIQQVLTILRASQQLNFTIDGNKVSINKMKN